MEWWSKEREIHRGTSVVVKMENPNWSMLELESPDDANADSNFSAQDKVGRGKNAKQLTWVLLLKAHRAAGCVAWLAQGLWSLLAAVKRRIYLDKRSGNREEGNKSRMAFQSPPFADSHNFGIGLAGSFAFGVYYSLDRMILSLGCLWIRLKKIRPVPQFEFADGDLEQGGKLEDYPMVLVQIPMCNEMEVYQQSIAAVCNLDWPKERMLVQVLDDSDDVDVQLLIKAEVQKWQQRDINILYRHRVIRTGYKAGNLKSAMNCDYVKEYEFVAIFDADFQPSSDFLKKTVPHFKGNDDLALVQARWAFVNKDENLLTRLQNINLCFHFEVEQQVNGVFINFFGFNGTAGVWRIKALEESGGWLERTTVEDMDIAVRAHLNGWKFIFLNDVECLCELPESYEAYRKQQHRWHSGPMQLFRLCLPDIIRSNIGFSKKANLIFLFFLLRKLVLPFYSFTLFCIILPMTMFLPEAELPAWVICYVPAIMSFLNILPAPRSFPFIVPYLLFENTMSVTKFNAMISGLFQLGSAYEWVVTKKLGRSSEADLVAFMEKESRPQLERPRHQRGVSESGLDVLNKLNEQQQKQPLKKKANRLYRKELALAFLLLTAAARSLLSAQGIHFYFLLFQGVSFLLVGFDLIGEQGKMQVKHNFE
ncbi:hypothetical protein SUGI_0523020 [Cryptomeria japonica]|nr:hypothetical protein SUGI_0523020 [Cryptomeria japonica]